MAKEPKKGAAKAPGVSTAAIGISDPDGRKYRAEDALRTLARAEEIRRDGALMRDVETCRRDKMRDLASIKVEVAPKTMKGAK